MIEHTRRYGLIPSASTIYRLLCRAGRPTNTDGIDDVWIRQTGGNHNIRSARQSCVKLKISSIRRIEVVCRMDYRLIGLVIDEDWELTWMNHNSSHVPRKCAWIHYCFPCHSSIDRFEKVPHTRSCIDRDTILWCHRGGKWRYTLHRLSAEIAQSNFWHALLWKRNISNVSPPSELRNILYLMMTAILVPSSETSILSS